MTQWVQATQLYYFGRSFVGIQDLAKCEGVQQKNGPRQRTLPKAIRFGSNCAKICLMKRDDMVFLSMTRDTRRPVQQEDDKGWPFLALEVQEGQPRPLIERSKLNTRIWDSFKSLETVHSSPMTIFSVLAQG